MGKGQAFDKMGLTGLKMSSKLGSKRLNYTSFTPGTQFQAKNEAPIYFG